ncbi:UNVERIFIED_CONTAM: hypothetical protein H355_002778, partial [Colinus virginianus]
VPAQQGQVYPVPCTVPGSWELPMEPSGDVAVLMEDLRYPAPTVGCASAQTAPLTCTATTVGADAVMTSSDVTGDVVDVADLLTWINGEFGGCRAGGWLAGCSSWELPMEPSGDVAVLMEDLRYPAPTVGCASAQTAPLTCTATTVGADEAMTSSDVTGDTVDVEDLLTRINAVMTSSDVTGDVVDVEDLLTWINGEFGGCRAGGWLAVGTEW